MNKITISSLKPKNNSMKEKYVSLKEFVEVCEKYYNFLTYREICYLYLGFNDDLIEYWNKIHITEKIVIYVQHYITNNK